MSERPHRSHAALTAAARASLVLAIALAGCETRLLPPPTTTLSGTVTFHHEPGTELPGFRGVSVIRTFPPVLWLPTVANRELAGQTPIRVTETTTSFDFHMPYVLQGNFHVGAWASAVGDIGNPEMQGVLGGMCAGFRGEGRIALSNAPIDDVEIHAWGQQGRLDPCFAEEAPVAGDAGSAADGGAPSDPFEGYGDECLVDKSPGASPFSSPDCRENAPLCVPWPFDATEGNCAGVGCLFDPGRCPEDWVCLNPDLAVEGLSEVGWVCVNTAWAEE